ncbi:MAG: TonB-dependent receptor [Sphingobium sp.]|nr:TonB-dependent receptor [Sphingobium sp.]
MKKIILCSAAPIALMSMMAGAAHAQSTGTIDFEQDSIIVTGSLTKGVGGIEAPKSTKAKAVLNQEMIARAVPGQSVNDIINLIPGVSFQNNDPFGSAGGKMTIRGFDDTRISQTVDGLQLNDSGGYSLYSNQNIDPELIEQVNVNLGTTDVDSPSASATGSTVNIRTLTPSDDFGVKLVGSLGRFDYMRLFGMVETGVFTPFGTKAWFSASSSTNDNTYGIGKIDKKQYNAKIYQPIGADGDFVSVAGHYNVNRNNFFGSVPLRSDADRIVSSASSGRFPNSKDERFYALGGCETDTPQAGVKDTPAKDATGNNCGSLWDYRWNPSNTGNIRVNSRFTLAEGLVLTVDPNYQYTKANGGGTSVGRETPYNGSNTNRKDAYGYIGGSPYFGVDLNGDGDLLDEVLVATPSLTQTHRIGVNASLRWEITDSQIVRVNYTYDRARHRQTGEVGLLNQNGFGADYFPDEANPLKDKFGNIMQKRDRLSWAILHKVSGEYSGRFMDDALRINIGIAAPFMRRNLTNYCHTTSASGFVNCGVTGADGSAYDSFLPTDYSKPQQRVMNYDKILPNAGLSFDFTPAFGMFANYSKGMQVPGTDNLYDSFFFPAGNAEATPVPETTDNFDIGLRYRSGTVQAQLTGWYTNYKNRLARSYDVELDETIYRNLGTVEKYGVDGSISFQPVPEALLYVWGSYLKSKIKDNVITGEDNNGNSIYALTKGKRESGSPVYTLGARAQFMLGPVELAGQVKRTGARYVNDQNLPIYQTIGGARTQVYGAKAPAYTLVDFDARINLGRFTPLGDKTYLQFNLLNAFDKLYVGSFNGDLSETKVPNAQIGYPRTFIGSLIVGF